MRVAANKGRLMRGVGVNFGVEIWLARRGRKPKIAVGGEEKASRTSKSDGSKHDGIY